MRANALKFAAYIVAQITLKGLYNGIVNSIKYFCNNVKTNGAWDLKSKKEWKLGNKDHFRFKGTKMRFDDPGNMHFGYVGSVLFPLDILVSGSKGECICIIS